MKRDTPFISPKSFEFLLLIILLALLACAVILGLLSWQQPEYLGLIAGGLSQQRWMSSSFTAAAILALLTLTSTFVLHKAGNRAFDEVLDAADGDDNINAADEKKKAVSPSVLMTREIKQHLRSRYGPFWRYRVRLLLVTGDDAARETLLPGLRDNHWLEGSRTVLIDGGSLGDAPDADRYHALRTLRRGRPLDGIVRVLAVDQSLTPQQSDSDLRALERIGALLRWQPPVWLWQLCGSDWPQHGRTVQTVGATFPRRAQPQEVAAQLNGLLPQLRAQGMAQVAENLSYDFLLRLGQRLGQGGSERWQTQLTPWLWGAQPRIFLRGLMFSLAENGPPPDAALPRHAVTLPATWQGVVRECARLRGRRVGAPWQQTLAWALMAMCGLWGAGMLLSFTLNRQQIIRVAENARTLAAAGTAASDRQLAGLHALRNDAGRLKHWQQGGAPWYQRFGLDHHAPLLAAMMPWYGVANHRLIRDPAAAALHQALAALVSLPPDGPQRAAGAADGHARLKALLMMAHPDKGDGEFYARVMKTVQPSRAGISPGLWQGLAPDLWAFYLDALPHRPQWAITPDAGLVSRSRQLLLQQLGRRNAESTLYQAMLKSVRGSVADLTLEAMTAGTDARRLFSSDDVVPGVFTRQAWEGGVRQAIEKAARTRRDEVDWVLSDGRGTPDAVLSPEALAARLTQRYFTDFAGSWLRFLNGLRLNRTDSIAGVTDQLTLMSDVRQSPLIALMNHLAWQGQAGQQGGTLPEALLSRVKTLTGGDGGHAIDPQGPLDATFGPLLTLTGNTKTGRMAGDDGLSLQTYLTRLTRVRLRLQQVAGSADPQERMQALAQTVFRGKSVDLTDTRAYGSLMAASLGEEWSGFGQTVFVQPLTRAWEAVLQPSAASLNARWARSVVSPWQSAFDGRYPFAAGSNDASLPMLAEFLRKDSGRIERFLTTELSGVLHKEGSRWVPDRTGSQGLTFNPAFLRAINRLSGLSDVLFTDGQQGIRFELQARPVPQVVETQLTIDGQRLRYFNQMAEWQTFHWPGETFKPGTLVTWSTTQAGARLYGDWGGTWGLIRWLEQGKREALDRSRWMMRFAAPDGRTLEWVLRSELGSGPLQLLQLRNFTLPAEIFSVDEARAAQAFNSDDEVIMEGEG